MPAAIATTTGSRFINIAAPALSMLVFVLAGVMIPASDSAAQEPDSREAYSRISPDWLMI